MMVLVVTINWEWGQLNLSDFIVFVGFSIMSPFLAFNVCPASKSTASICRPKTTRCNTSTNCSSMMQELLTLMMSNIEYGWMIMERVEIYSRVCAKLCNPYGPGQRFTARQWGPNDRALQALKRCSPHQQQQWSMLIQHDPPFKS